MTSTLPILSKTYQFNVNNIQEAQGSALACNRQAWLTIKNILIGFAQNPWQVVASSNGVVANSSDNWATTADLIWANDGTAHSWIVLKQTKLKSTYQLLIDFGSASSDGNKCHVYWTTHASGFSSLTSITATPTATNQVYIMDYDGANINSPVSSSDVRIIIHGIQSTDGEVTRIFVFRSDLCPFWLDMSKINNPTTGWSDPIIGAGVYSHVDSGWPTNSLVYTYLLDTTFTFPYYVSKVSIHNSTLFEIAYTGESYFNGSFKFIPVELVVANEISAGYGLFPIGIASTTTGAKGRHGSLYDMWWGQRGLGDFFPADGSKQFAQLAGNSIVISWNGTTMLTS